MIEHSKKAVNNSAKESDTSVLWSGYHKNCSVAKKLALPGSDLDGWSIIIDGNQDNKNRFCAQLWKNTNPIFVSIRHEFPYVFTIDELLEWSRFIDDLVNSNNLNLKAEEYENNLNELNDFEKALEFNIDLKNIIKKSKITIDDIIKKCPSLRALIQDKASYCANNNIPQETAIIWITSDISTCLEQLRSGLTLTGDKNSEKLSQIKNSYLYKYGNLSMQELSSNLKQKLKERQEKFSTDNWFNGLSLNEKMNIILKMIYESYNNSSKNNTYETYSNRDKRISAETQNYFNMFDNPTEINEKRSNALAIACSY